ncbi:MAG: hypothetical protein IKK19_01080 [Bacteroidales bacterium]|nr:hypothetical protein [Bacteroidales bacterium]
MREIFKISALVAAFFAMLALVSCSKTEPAAEEYAEDEKIAIEVRVNAGAEVTVKSNQGNTITSLKVWGYEIIGVNTSPAPDALPVVFGEFNGGSGTIHMLATCVGKKYRFMAVANDALFGKMYKAREHYGEEEPLTLNSHLTYKDLSTAVFDASAGNGGIFESFPNGDSPESMPFSHWTDVTIEQGTTTLEIQVFRPVAKAQLFAKLKNATDGLLQITNVSIKTAKDFPVPNEGFLFSSATANDLPNTITITAPAYWGEYNDVTVLVPDIGLKNTGTNGNLSYTIKNIDSENSTYVGSTFLYENNNGDNWKTASHTNPDTYKTGAYYMEIQYSYADHTKSDTSYVPLPAIVRNRDYKIDATFDISRGLINVAFTVSDWEQTDIESGQSGANGSGDDVQDVEFAYPTFEIWPVKKKTESEYDYSKPIAQYNKTGETVDATGAFQFYFKMQPYTSNGINREWTISISNNDKFSILVEKSSSESNSSSEQMAGDWSGDNPMTNEAAGKLYRISIYPKESYSTAGAATTNVMITYPASWISGSDHLLINSGGGGTLWSDSGHERHQILVTQGADLQ